MAVASREYRFKATSTSAEQVWTIRHGQLLRRGAKKAIKLEDVLRAKWREITYRGTQSAWLTLETAADTFRIECGEIGVARGEFLAFIHDTSIALAAAQPAVKIEIDTGGAWRRAVFMLAVLAAIVGFLLISSAILSSDGMALSPALLLGNLVAGAAIYVALTNRPDRSLERLDPKAFAVQLGVGNSPPVAAPENDTDQT